MPDERRDGYLDREGWQKLAGLASDMQYHAVTLGQVAEVADRSDRTLRGINGGDGLVARVGALEKAGTAVEKREQAGILFWAKMAGLFTAISGAVEVIARVVASANGG
jgi:hypothetical protein